MGITIKSQGLTKAINMFKNLEKTLLSEKLYDFIAEKAIEEINKQAKDKLQTSDNYISNNKYERTDKGIVIYNDSATEDGFNYSLIIEYGSGAYAEMPHIGNTLEFVESNYEWWYAFGKNIVVHGQEPKHIYTDAAKIIRKEINSWITEFIESEMK